MVIYDLACDQDHVFEGWFKSADDYKQQQANNLLTCPVCDSHSVRKTPSASHIQPKGTKNHAQDKKLSLADKQEFIQEISRYIVEHTVDVGTGFAEEAKKIHYGEAPERAIRGQATVDEVKELTEEGIAVVPLPLPIVDKNKLN